MSAATVATATLLPVLVCGGGCWSRSAGVCWFPFMSCLKTFAILQACLTLTASSGWLVDGSKLLWVA